MYDGAKDAADGAGALKDGTSELKDGTETLADGTETLLKGAETLKDGMAKFDREGVHKLTDVLEGDGRQLIDRLKALKSLAEEYTSFAGSSYGDSSVRFIMRTEPIGEDEQ